MAQQSMAVGTVTTCRVLPTCRSPYLAEQPWLLPPTQHPAAADARESSAARAAALVGAVAASQSSSAACSTIGSRRMASSAFQREWQVCRASAYEEPPPKARRQISPTAVKPRAHVTAPRSSSTHGGAPLRSAHSPALWSNSLHPGQQRAAPPGRLEQPAPPHRPQIVAQHPEPSADDTPRHAMPPSCLREPTAAHDVPFAAISGGGGVTASGGGGEASGIGGLSARTASRLSGRLGSSRVYCTSHSVSGRHVSDATLHESRTDADDVARACGGWSSAAAPTPGRSGDVGLPYVTLDGRSGSTA